MPAVECKVDCFCAPSRSGSVLPDGLSVPQLAESLAPERKVELVGPFQGVMLVLIVVAVPLVGHPRSGWGAVHAHTS